MRVPFFLTASLSIVSHLENIKKTEIKWSDAYYVERDLHQVSPAFALKEDKFVVMMSPLPISVAEGMKNRSKISLATMS